MNYQLRNFVCATIMTAILSAVAVSAQETEISPKDLILKIVFEDGKTLDLENPILQYRMMTRDRYGRFYSSESYPISGIRLRKVTTNKGVTSIEKKDLNVSEMRTIEFIKNKSDECIAFITLNDGRTILTSNQLGRVAKDKWPAGISPSTDFEGFYHGDPANTIQYELRAYAAAGGQFNAGPGDALNCPSVFDESLAKSVRIAKLVIGRKK